MFAVLMGLRRSEIIAVKYADIDYINRTLHVERQLGIVPMSDKKDFQPKTYTKQEIELKTESSDRIIPIPDILFEAIIEERQKYEKNRRRRINDKHNPFFDGNYICCSTYGKPRSKDFHWVHFKKLLKEIITIDVYGDNREIIEDCLENLEPFIDEVLPEEEVIDLCDVDCMDLVALELIE